MFCTPLERSVTIAKRRFATADLARCHCKVEMPRCVHRCFRSQTTDTSAVAYTSSSRDVSYIQRHSGVSKEADVRWFGEYDLTQFTYTSPLRSTSNHVWFHNTVTFTRRSDRVIPGSLRSSFDAALMDSAVFQNRIGDNRRGIAGYAEVPIDLFDDHTCSPAQCRCVSFAAAAPVASILRSSGVTLDGSFSRSPSFALNPSN